MLFLKEFWCISEWFLILLNKHFLNFSQNFWPFDTPGCASTVIWNRYEQFLLSTVNWRILTLIMLHKLNCLEQIEIFFIEPGLDESGKNQKSWFFLLCLKYTLRKCFDSKILSVAEQSGNQFLSSPNLLVVGKLKNWLPDCSATDRILESKHFLKVYFKHSRKNQDFWFLPLSSKPGSMKKDHLNISICSKKIFWDSQMLENHKRIRPK